MGYIVYMHIAPNNKKYVGITKQIPKNRFQNGLGYRRCPHFYNAIIKYGWENFKHIILLENLSKQEAEQKEIEIIKQYKSNNKRYGYNIANGGNCVGTISEETRNKIRQSKIGTKMSIETRLKMSISQRNISQESRLKKSISHIGKKHSQETKDKIGKAHKNKINSEDSIKKMIISKSNKSKPVFQYSLDKKLIKKWSSASRIEAETQYYKRHIIECAKHEKLSAYGFIWSYVEL